MAVKRTLAAALAAMLLLTGGLTGLAGATDADGTAPPVTVSPPEDSLPPDESAAPQPAEFYIQVGNGANGVKIEGYFPGYMPEMRDIRSWYSFDGESYHPVTQGDWMFSDEILEGDTPKNTVASQDQSPLKEYLEKEIDTFYIRLHYRTDEGEKFSQAAQFSRPTQTVPLPEDAMVVGIYPIATMRVGRASFQYNVTVKAGATAAEVAALLPETLPIDVQLITSHGAVEVQRAAYPAAWSLPEVVAQEGAVVENAATVTPPETLVFEGLNALYSIEPPPMPPPLRLNLNVATGPLYALHKVDKELLLTFPLKPSGATEIIPSYSLDGGETWVATADLLSYNEPVDAWPKNPDYRYVTLFSPEQSPYREYLAGELDGFLVRVDITGGTLQGSGEVAKWPMDYEPPIKDGGGHGSGGNENNTGSGGGAGSGSHENGGQRPALPAEEPPDFILLPPVRTESEPREETVASPAPAPAAELQADVPVAELPAPPVEIVSEAVASIVGTPIVPEPPPAVALPPKSSPVAPVEETPQPTPLPEAQPTPEENEPPPSMAESKPIVLPIVTKLSPPQQEEPPRELAKTAFIPVAAVGALLVGGGAVALTVLGGNGALAGGGRKLLAAIKRLLKHAS